MTLLYESYSFGIPKRMRVTKKRFAIPTILLSTIGRIINGTWESLEGQTVPVGTVARISGTLYTDKYAMVPGGKTIKLYAMLPGSASWTLLATLTTDTYSNFRYLYTLPSTGSYKFYYEFEGDSEYQGCSS